MVVRWTGAPSPREVSISISGVDRHRASVSASKLTHASLQTVATAARWIRFAQLRRTHVSTASEFCRIAVIGTGMMGPGIAACLALAGHEVWLSGRSDQSLARGLDSARGGMAVLCREGLVSQNEVDGAV